MKGFRDFILRGNVVDLAVGIVIGAAFTAVVTGFVTSFITPLIQLLGGGGDGGGAAIVKGAHGNVAFTWGAFIGTVINFLIVAAVIYFLVVLPVNKLMARVKRGEVEAEEGPASEEAPTAEIELLTEIRDALKSRP